MSQTTVEPVVLKLVSERTRTEVLNLVSERTRTEVPSGVIAAALSNILKTRDASTNSFTVDGKRVPFTLALSPPTTKEDVELLQGADELLPTRALFIEDQIDKSAKTIRSFASTYSGGRASSGVPRDIRTGIDSDGAETSNFIQNANNLVDGETLVRMAIHAAPHMDPLSIRREIDPSKLVSYGNSFTHSRAVPQMVTNFDVSMTAPIKIPMRMVIDGEVLDTQHDLARPFPSGGTSYMSIPKILPSVPLGKQYFLRSKSFDNAKGDVFKQNDVLRRLTSKRHNEDEGYRETLMSLQSHLRKCLDQGVFRRVDSIKNSPGISFEYSISVKVDGTTKRKTIVSLRSRDSPIGIVILGVFYQKGGKIYVDTDDGTLHNQRTSKKTSPKIGVITSFRTDKSDFPIFAGVPYRRTNVVKDNNFDAKVAKAVILGIGDGKEKEKMQLGLFTHDPWTGFPFHVQSANQYGDDKDPGEETYDISRTGWGSFGPNYALTRTILDPMDQRLQYSGIEFHAVYHILSSIGGRKRLNGWKKGLINLILSHVSMKTNNNVPLVEAYALDDIEQFIDHNLRNSVIYGEHKYIIGSGIGDVSEEDFSLVQCSRMYLSLFWTRVRNTNILSVLPHRYLVAQNIPISLTQYGYVMWEAAERVMAFFKEDSVLGGVIAAAKHNFLEAKLEFAYRENAHKLGFACLLTSRVILIKESEEKELSDVLTHFIRTEDGIWNIDPLVCEAMSRDDFPTNKLCVLYDPRFVMLIYKPRLPTDRNPASVHIRPVPRPSRFIPNSKNIIHNALSPSSGSVPFGSTTSLYHGYVGAIGASDFLPTLKDNWRKAHVPT